MVKRDTGIPGLEHRNAAFEDVVHIIEQVTFDITPVSYSNYPFIVLPDALVLFLEEIDVKSREKNSLVTPSILLEKKLSMVIMEPTSLTIRR